MSARAAWRPLRVAFLVAALAGAGWSADGPAPPGPDEPAAGDPVYHMLHLVDGRIFEGVYEGERLTLYTATGKAMATMTIERSLVERVEERPWPFATAEPAPAPPARVYHVLELADGRRTEGVYEDGVLTLFSSTGNPMGTMAVDEDEIAAIEERPWPFDDPAAPDPAPADASPGSAAAPDAAATPDATPDPAATPAGADPAPADAAATPTDAPAAAGPDDRTYHVIHLRDGRTLEGVYEGGTIELFSSKGRRMGSMTVDERDVVRVERRPWPFDPSAAEEPAPSPEDAVTRAAEILRRAEALKAQAHRARHDLHATYKGKTLPPAQYDQVMRRYRAADERCAEADRRVDAAVRAFDETYRAYREDGGSRARDAFLQAP